MLYKTRIMVSFDGYCPLHCKHCYTYELHHPLKKQRTVDEIVESISGKQFDIIYVSQSYENFQKEEDGIVLCKALYDRYKKDIFIITRSRLSGETINQIYELNKKMNDNGNRLFLAVSVCAEKSYGITESINLCPTPEARLENLKQAYECKINTLLIIRPLFPDTIIPVTECIQMIQKAKSYIDVVVSSGLIVTQKIEEKLHLENKNIKYSVNGDSEYLADLNKEGVKYLDVEEELKKIELYCKKIDIPFYLHSMPALNHISEKVLA